jgi:tetratricopeptide (TPR) repeat protein
LHISQRDNYLGRLTEAREHLPKAIAHYREEDFLSELNDPGVNARIWAGINESYLGYPDSARRYLEDAIALARRLKRPLGLAFAATLGSMDYCRQGDLERASRAAQEAEHLSAELGLPLFEVMARNASAWIRARMGRADGAADVIQRGIAEYDAQHFYLARAWNLTVLSETQALAGATDTALVTIDQALETNPDELLYRPWALLFRGELRFRSAAGRETDLQLAERDLREAIQLARGMSSKMDELRATLRLALLLRDTGRRDEARAMLAEIYNWFTEGFDTLHLKEAKALLDDLSRPG